VIKRARDHKIHICDKVVFIKDVKRFISSV
jgi:hypothetical protein